MLIGSDPGMSQETEYNNEGEWEEDIHERENELDDLRRQADATAAKIQALKKLKLVKSKYGQPNYTIDNDVLEDIDEIITKNFLFAKIYLKIPLPFAKIYLNFCLLYRSNGPFTKIYQKWRYGALRRRPRKWIRSKMAPHPIP